MDNKNSAEKYADIINMSRPQSPGRPKMSRHERAAQFSPFAALVGYDGEIDETARYTENETELSEEQKYNIDERLRILDACADQRPPVKITYFVPDEKKKGGAYISVTGKFKCVREYERDVLLEPKTSILIDRIRKVDSPVFEKFDI